MITQPSTSPVAARLTLRSAHLPAPRDELCRSVVRANPPVITLAPPAPIVAVGAKKADVVVVETVAMEPTDTPYAVHAAHAARVTTHATDVTSCKSKGANMSSAEAATAMTSAKTASAKTASAEAASAEAATAMTTTAPATTHQHQKTAPCIQIGVIGKARLREGCRGRMSKRKSADNPKGDDATFHDCTSRGHLHDKFVAPPQAIGAHLRLATDAPPSGFFLKGACK
jgi:hypothetical protein